MIILGGDMHSNKLSILVKYLTKGISIRQQLPLDFFSQHLQDKPLYWQSLP